VAGLIDRELPVKYVRHWQEIHGASIFEVEWPVDEVVTRRMTLLGRTELARYAYLSAATAAKSPPPGPLKLRAGGFNGPRRVPRHRHG
jgi:hypothetical protein